MFANPGGQTGGAEQKLPANGLKFVPVGQVTQESKTASYVYPEGQYPVP